MNNNYKNNYNCVKVILKANYENYFKGMFESIPDYRKLVILMFLIQKDKNLLKERASSKSDIDCFCKRI